MRLLSPFVTIFCLALLLAVPPYISEMRDFIQTQIMLKPHLLAVICFSILGLSIVSFSVWVLRGSN